MRHVHFICQGYEQKTDTGQLTDAVQVDVFADSEPEALARAALLVSKPHWRVQSVVEHDPDQEEARGLRVKRA